MQYSEQELKALVSRVIEGVRGGNATAEGDIPVGISNRHTAHMHSKNIEHLSRFAKAVETTIFVKNAPSYAGIGFGGEGHTTFTIAGPTGEGITSARSFTRLRRCVMADSFRII